MWHRPRPYLCAALLGIAFLTHDGHAQSRDPHLPPPESLPSLNEFIRIDDMLLWPEQYQQLTAPPVNRRQANFFALGQRQFYWEWGVIPYEMAPNFSEAERQRIVAAMTTWTRTAPITFVPRTTQT